MLTKHLSLRQVSLSLTPKQKIILSLLAAALCTIPLWLGLERVHSAPAKVVSPPLTTAAPPPGLTPSVTLDVPDEVLINEQFKFKVTFNPGTAVGYGPFIDIVLPAGGIDYNALDPSSSNPGPCDGVTYVPGSAQMIGVNGGSIPLTTNVVTAPCTHTAAGACATLTHPYAANGISSVAFPNILVPEGAQLVTIKLPFGSFEPNQPPIVIQVTAQVSDHADVNRLLNIYARAGFQFGSLNANNDPITDPPATVLSPGGVPPSCTTWTASAPVTPVLFTFKVEDRLSANPGPCFDGVDNGQNGFTDSDDPDCKHGKSYDGPEDETATGPNYPHRYKIILNIANKMTVNNLSVQDCLPNNMVLSKVVSTSPAPSSISPSPPPLGPANLGTNCMTFNYNSITGGPLATDIVIEVEFYIPEKDANGALILGPNCESAQSINQVKAEGDWTPVDPRDWQGSPTPVSQHVVSNASLQGHVLTDKCIAIQKSVAIAIDTGAKGPTPGDTLRYTLNFQVSDFKTVGLINITDYLSDGQQLVNVPSAPMLTIGDKYPNSPYTNVGFNKVTLFVTPDQNFVCPVPGEIKRGTKLVFAVSSALAEASTPTGDSRHQLGILTGGWASPPTSTTPATGQIVFYAQIQDQFAHPHPPGDQSVDKDDPITNCVQVTGTVYTNADWPAKPVPTSVSIGDDSNSATAIVTDKITKSVYAIKRGGSFVCGGSSSPCPLPPAAPEVRPGDQVTFRIEKTIPSSDAEQLTIQDFLPLPVFDVSDPDATSPPGPPFVLAPDCLLVPPGPGKACRLMPTHTLPVTPTFIPDPVTNSITFDYHSFNKTDNLPRKIDLLFTSTVTNKPFADGLYLTNEAKECEDNTFGFHFCQAAIAQVNLREPNLRIRKGVIATDNPNGLFSQPASPQTAPNPTATPPAGATLTLGGISGVVNSTDLAAGALVSDLSNVDANDIVTFAITIENLGGYPAHDVKMEDIIPHDINGNPTCFTIVPKTIRVKRGTGVTVNSALYNIVPPVPTTTGFTVTFTPAFPINASDPTSGKNIIVITFQAELLADIMPGCCHNKAEIKHYVSQLNGPDFVAAGFTPPFDDSAQVCTNPTLTKSVVATSEVHTSPQISATPQTPANTPQVTIGEIVRYRLVVRWPEGGGVGVNVVDALPLGMKFLNDGTARIAFVANGPGIAHPFPFYMSPAFNVIGNESTLAGLTLNAAQTIPVNAITVGPSCGDDPTFNLAGIRNNDNDPDSEFIVIEFNALVCNVASNRDGTTLPNTFSVWVDGTQIATSDPINVIIVEPKLTMTKTVAPNPAIKGQTLTYTVQYTNNGTADAFDVELKDTLPSGLTFGTITSGCPFTPAVPSNTITVTCSQVPKAPNPGSTVILTYQALTDSASCPVTLNNRASLTWTSLPGPQGTMVNQTGSSTPGNSGLADGERDGVTVPLTVNNYATTASAAVKIDCPCNATITGLKFNDLNGNGVRDTGEPGLANWTIKVTDSSGHTQTTITDSQGNYSFTVPAPGTYSVSELLQSGWTQTVPSTGTYFEIVSPGQVVNNRNFGNELLGACATPPPGMVAWWPLDETMWATTVTDIIGANNATPQPGPLGPIGPSTSGPLPGIYSGVTPPAMVGGSLYFYATRFLQVPNASAPSLNFGAGDFTIDAWVYPIPMGPTLVQPIVDKLQLVSSPAGGIGYRLFIRNGQLHFILLDGLTAVDTPAPITSGQWHHVAVVRKGGTPNTVEVYIGGQLVSTSTPVVSNISNNADLLIGGIVNSPGIGGLPSSIVYGNIAIDEVEIFNRALAQSEIDRIYRAGSAGKCKCLLVSNEKITCNPDGTFSYTLTVKNLSSSTASYLTFSPVTPNVTITPALPIPPLLPGGSTNVTVTISGPDAVSGANVCFLVGLGAQSYIFVGCRTEHCITLPTCQSSGCAIPPRGMVAWWPMDLQNGLVNDVAPPPDSLVNNWGASPANQPVFGHVGGASGALFFGAPALQVSPQSELDFGTGDFSIDAWVRIVSVAPGVISPIVDKFTTPGGPGFAFYVRNQKLELNVNGSTFVSTPPDMSFADPVANTGPWYHVAVTVQRSPAQANFYINGFSAGTSSAVPASSVNNGLPLLIGGTRLMPGTVRGGIAIDELELFKRVLTLTEVQSISSAGSAGKCRTGSLTVTKTITSQSPFVPPSTAVFPTTVACLPSGPNVNFNLSASAPTQTVNNIPVGSACTVTEGALPPPIAHPACGSLGWGTPTYAPGQTVTIPSTGGSQTVTVTNQYFCNTTSACATPPPGMVAWWPLDEQAGATVVTDIRGGHNGTPSSGSFPATNFGPPAKVGGKLFVGDNVSVPDDPSLKFGTGNFSVDAWFWIAESWIIGGVVDKLNIDEKKGYALYVQDDHLKFVMGNGTSFTTYTSTAQVGIVRTGLTWHHVAVTVDRSGGLSTFYIDGTSAGTFSALPSTVNIATTSTLLIGGSRLATPQICACEYLLDEVEIFNDVLPASDIRAIYNAGSAGKCTATIKGKKFNDLNQSKVLDAGEPGLRGWTIRVTDQGGKTQSTSTDAQGNYSFTVPAPGTYTLSEVQQDGWFPTTSARTITVAANESADVNFGNTTVRKGRFTFTPGMNEFCIWGGGGSFNSPRQIDNPNSQFGFNNSPALTGNNGGVRYGAFGLCYGRILLANDKVAFKYTFNAIPAAVLSYPDVNPDLGVPFPVSATRRNVFGGGLSPIGLQLYFRPQSRVKPFVNTSGGFIFFENPVPRLNGARFNFTVDFGGGVQVFRDSRRAFTFGYKYQHLSNGGRALNNPGFDGNVFYFGYSIFKAKKIAQGPQPAIREEKITRATLQITNRCPQPHYFRIGSDIKDPRFKQQTDAILIGANSTERKEVLFDAMGLKGKLKASVECLDCKEAEGCAQDRYEIPIEMAFLGSATPFHPPTGASTGLTSGFSTPHPVGIIPDNGCPAGSDRIIISMDDEDDRNISSVSGWHGAISRYETGTHFEFCRVDGNQFHGHPGGDYAVLKLSDNCPDGSVSFSRLFDNEHGSNKNWSSGTIDPNKQTYHETPTAMYFCFFPSTAVMTSFPNLGVPYGVFAAPSSAWLATGTVFTDDEDADNKDNTSGSAPANIANRFARIIYGSDNVFLGRNTYLLVAKVRN